MNYTIITDEKKLKEFINFLPELNKHETFCCNLFARSKYCKDIIHIKSDKQQMARFTSDKKHLFDKIKQLEIPIGYYKQGDTIVPQEALALYITINPRDTVKAIKKIQHELIDLDLNHFYDLNALTFSSIQKSISYKKFADFDFDNINVNDIIKVFKNNNYINLDALIFLETRGGCHVLVEFSKIQKQYEKTWYKNLQNIFGIDINTKSQFIPVPGTYQGGFTPKLITITNDTIL